MMPPVSLVIVVPREAPYIATTLPRLVSQLAVDERVAVIEPGATGIDTGLFDRVIELDASDAARRAIVSRYAEPGTVGDLAPAVHAALFGIDRAQHDLVAWFAPSVLLHAVDGWITSATDALARDERTWLAVTRGGPTPTSMTARLVRRFAPGRATHTSGTHFVCDRRRLYRSLRHLRATPSPLGATLSEALARREAFVQIVPGAWHLVPSSVNAPFPQWVDAIARAADADRLPPSQRDGRLRLDEPTARAAWRHALFPNGEAAPTGPRPVATLVERSVTRGAAPVSVVIPVRDRTARDVGNSIASLLWQTTGRPAEIILVSHGSKPACDAELRALARDTGVTLICVGMPHDAWCKPLALNTGVRATDPTVPHVMTMDGDMILADNFLEMALAELRREPRALLLCQSSDLPEGCEIPSDPAALHAQYAALRAKAALRPQYGTGGIQLLPRSFLFEVRGYDEDMRWWGALDTDMVKRAQRAGLRVAWLSDRTAMLHQWHPRKQDALAAERDIDDARDAWLRNHELMLERERDIVRNAGGWGAPLSSAP